MTPGSFPQDFELPRSEDALEQAGPLADTMTTVVTAPAEHAGESIGRYKLLQEIGAGGFGTVWMAEQVEPVSRRVALKIIKMGMDTREVIARFEQERQALAMMDHPNIAKVLDGGATPLGRPYFVMELVRGVRITKLCDDEKLPMAERLALFVEVCHAIQHAHQKGIIHRDIKPSNILVAPDEEGRPVPKVIDFGVAKAMDGSLTDKTLFTRFEQMIGTPAYMSPEQAGAGPIDIDTRSDVYSLGVLLYEMLTGRPPFDPKQLMSAGIEGVRRIIREVEPPKPSTCLGSMMAAQLTGLAHSRHTDASRLVSNMKGDLDWIVMKAMEKNRSRRYETANGFAADVERYLRKEPVVARPPTFGYRAGKFARRYKVPVAAAAAVLMALLLGVAGFAWQAHRIGVERDAAIAAGEAAEKARKAEEKARAEAESISKIFTEILKSPDPKRDGRKITVAETLDSAARKLEVDFGSQPARRAKLQGTLGNTYRALGLPREAIVLQEKVRDYYRGTVGSEHPDTLWAMNSLAVSYFDAGRRDEALKLRSEMAVMRRASIPAIRATLVAPATEWKWLHPTNGQDPAATSPAFHQAFAMPAFDDTGWKSGNDSSESAGGFGYGRAFVGVDIGKPENEAHRHTAYFRHTFVADEEHTNLELRCQFDDGIIVYLDGKEVLRDNMPPDPETYLLHATEAMSVENDGVVHRFPIPGALAAGPHTLAISVHNTAQPSSDLRLGGVTLVEVEPKGEKK